MAAADAGDRVHDEDVTRDDGMLFARAAGHEVRCEGECAPDDYIGDPINDPGVPGTVDDLPYDYGIEDVRAADETLDSIERPPSSSWGVGATGHPEEEERQLGTPEEAELWLLQQPLIEESDAEERHYAGLHEEDLLAVAEASAEDSAEVLPDAPGGTSSTGSSTGSDGS